MEKKDITGISTLFDRVAAILDEARSNVVRAINNRMVIIKIKCQVNNH
jgi:hypothetical protein